MQSAVQANRENPVLIAAIGKSSTIFNQIPLRDFIDEASRTEQAKQLYREVSDICNSRDPVTVCREKLCIAMLELAMYQVLVIPPSPQDDVTGLRGEPGITGELQEHLNKLLKTNDDLHALLSESTESLTPDTVWDALQRSYWTLYWYLETINATRIELGDYVDGDDWYRAFMHATSARSEHMYRQELEMPSCFDDDIAGMAPTAYSIFTDIVLSGVENPGLEWRDYYKNSNIPFVGTKLQ
jgi:hypothetical protein